MGYLKITSPDGRTEVLGSLPTHTKLRPELPPDDPFAGIRRASNRRAIRVARGERDGDMWINPVTGKGNGE